MDWKDIAETVGKAAPFVGSLLGGPAGAAAGVLVSTALGVDNTPEAVSTALGEPGSAMKLAELQATHHARLTELYLAAEANRLSAETAQLQAVNATMQVEAKSDHWPSYSWRPFNGFVVGSMAFGIYFVLPLCKVPVPAVPESVWVMFGAILGVASWFRGRAQVEGAAPSQTKG